MRYCYEVSETTGRAGERRRVCARTRSLGKAKAVFGRLLESLCDGFDAEACEAELDRCGRIGVGIEYGDGESYGAWLERVGE